MYFMYNFFLPELNECDPDPCLNGGTCVDGVRNYTCNCATFPEDGGLTYYTGRNCGTGEKQKWTFPATFTLHSTFCIILLSGGQSRISLYHQISFKWDCETQWQDNSLLLCCWQPHPQHPLVQGWQADWGPSGHWGCVCDSRSNPKFTWILPLWSFQQLWRSSQI